VVAIADDVVMGRVVGLGVGVGEISAEESVFELAPAPPHPARKKETAMQAIQFLRVIERPP
jgi:hypothetical protein